MIVLQDSSLLWRYLRPTIRQLAVVVYEAYKTQTCVIHDSPTRRQPAATVFIMRPTVHGPAVVVFEAYSKSACCGGVRGRQDTSLCKRYLSRLF